MPQKNRQYVLSPYTIHTYNRGLHLYPNYEIVVLEGVVVSGITNLSLEIKNSSGSGNIVSVIIYGSPDGIDYFVLDNELFPSKITPGQLVHEEFTVVTKFIRVTVEATENIIMDIHLHGITV